MRFLVFAFSLLVMLSCKKESVLPSLDLMKYGFPISVKAPDDVVVQVEDMGFMKDLTLKSGEDYFVQVYAADANSINLEKVLEKKKTDVETGDFFSKIISEEPGGFIYEKDLGDGVLDYDFVYVKIQGDKEYTFQTGLYGTFTQEQVKTMLNSVK